MALLCQAKFTMEIQSSYRWFEIKQRKVRLLSELTKTWLQFSISWWSVLLDKQPSVTHHVLSVNKESPVGSPCALGFSLDVCSSLEVWLVGRLQTCQCFQASQRRPPQYVLCEESGGWGLPNWVVSVVKKKLFDLVDAGLPALVSLVYEYIRSCIAKAKRGLSSGMYTTDLNIRTKSALLCHLLWAWWWKTFS